MITIAGIINEDDVRQIRREYKVAGKKALNVIELARRYGVSQEAIRNIATGRRYKWVKDE